MRMAAQGRRTVVRHDLYLLKGISGRLRIEDHELWVAGWMAIVVWGILTESARRAWLLKRRTEQ
jgi:hypothetical protein